MSYNLFLDDERNPQTDRDWVTARSYDEFTAIIEKRGCPSYASFDHDLSDGAYRECFRAAERGEKLNYENIKEKTGMECAKWLVQKDIEAKGRFIPQNFEFNVHSANPLGAENIRSYLKNYIDFKSNSSPL